MKYLVFSIDDGTIFDRKTIKIFNRFNILATFYLNSGLLSVKTLGRGYSWLDTGTHDSLTDASLYVKDLERHQGLKISCIEEISYFNKWITKEDLIRIGTSMKNSPYGQYLLKIAGEKILYPLKNE